MTTNPLVAEASGQYLAEAAGQAVPVGYKQTEVGLIPEDWDCKFLGELGDVVRGGSPRPAGDPKYFNGKFIPWLTVASLTNISSSQQKVVATSSMLTELGSRYSRVLEKNTLIISNSGATLGVAKILDIRCCANDGVAAIINQKYGNKSFLAHFINTKTKDLHDKVATGNGQPNLNTDLIKIIAVPFPKEEEQTAIANALSDVDALINELEKLIAKKQAIKTATLQQLLTGRTRLRQFALSEDGTKKGYKQSELGEIPEDWQCLPLPQTTEKGPASIKIGPFGSALKQEYLVKTGYKVYGQENIYEKDMAIGDRFISKDHFLKLKSCSIIEGDFLISMMGTVGKCFIVPANFEEGIMDSHLLRLRVNAKLLNANLLTQLFQTRIVLDQIKQLSVGGIMEGLSSKIIKSIFVPLSDNIEEQTAIATILSDMDADIQTLQQRLSKTRQIKQGMMQELLTGKTRLLKEE